MYTQAEIKAAFDEEAGDVAVLATIGEVTRWFNDGQARLGWYRRDTADLTWTLGASVIQIPTPMAGIDHLLYPDGNVEERWVEGVQCLQIIDYEGATSAGSARIIFRAYWPDVTSSAASLLPRMGDAACISYALYRFYRKLVSNRSFYQRYATLAGTNRVDVTDLSDIADDHYRDFNDLRQELPVEPASTFFG
jgi:hypothetical protein